MGIFKAIKKIGKKILKGTKKVFKKVGKFVGKIAGSKWGKALLITGAIVLGGIAVYGAIQGVGMQAAGTTFMSKFAAGAKGAMDSLGAAATTAKGALGMAAPVTGTAEGGLAAMTAAPGGAGSMAPGAGFWGGAGTTGAETIAAGTGAGTGIAETSVLSGLGKGALNFAKSTGGGLMLAGGVQGYAAGKQAEEDREWKEKQSRYYDDAWDNYEGGGDGGGSAGGEFLTSRGGGALNRARGSRYTPGDKDVVAGYARPS